MKAQSIRVWDPLVRIIHWSLVALFATSWISSEIDTDVHVISGYCLVTLILVRLIWGIVGTRHARFGSFVRPPSEVLAYVRSLVRGEPDYHEGHNPLGGWMIVALLTALLMTGFSGLMLYGSEGHGPLAGFSLASMSPVAIAYADDDEDEADERYGHLGEHEEGEELWEEVHEFFANLTFALVFLHLFGVMVASLLHGENLVGAMISGRKPGREGSPS